MRRFLEFIALAKSKSIILPDAKSQTIVDSKPTDKFWSNLGDCRPFVFSPGDEPLRCDFENIPVYKNHAYPQELRIDAPFAAFSIEVSGEKPLAIGPARDKQPTNVFCLTVFETQPKQYLIFASVEFLQPTGQSNFTVVQSPLYLEQVHLFLLRLQREKTGVENVRQKIKIGEGKTKRFHTIKQVVHVRPRAEPGEGTGKEQIDWSHRFEVRGHWRSIDGIGKDRAGIYCIDRYTWVKDFVKGPEHLPLVRKTRLVKEP